MFFAVARLGFAAATYADSYDIPVVLDATNAKTPLAILLPLGYSGKTYASGDAGRNSYRLSFAGLAAHDRVAVARQPLPGPGEDPRQLGLGRSAQARRGGELSARGGAALNASSWDRHSDG